jgi:putative transposon-encoded protein
MARRMKMSQIESQVTKIGNGAHVLVPKQWIDKKVRVTLIEKGD